jgi:hypothetical protein
LYSYFFCCRVPSDCDIPIVVRVAHQWCQTVCFTRLRISTDRRCCRVLLIAIISTTSTSDWTVPHADSVCVWSHSFDQLAGTSRHSLCGSGTTGLVCRAHVSFAPTSW